MSSTDYNFQEMPFWPILPKIGVFFAGLIAVMALFYLGYAQQELQNVESLERVEATKKAEFIKKADRAKQLDVYKEQLSQIESALTELIEQLPKKNETSKLLRAINTIAEKNGLSPNMRWLDWRETDYVTEVPIEMSIRGTYNQIGEFIAEISNLERIVNLDDFSIKRKNEFTGESTEIEDEELEMIMNAVTYIYLDDEIEDE